MGEVLQPPAATPVPDGLYPADRFFAIAQELRQIIER
jgi:hypothetical protein